MGKALLTPQSRDSGSTTNSSGHVSLHNPVLHIMLIIILGLLAYSNTFHVPFQFDDGTYIVDNHIIKDLKHFSEPLKTLEITLPDRTINNFFKTRFVALLTFALNYNLHGLNVTGYHVVNISIHILNAILLYWLVVLTFRTSYFKVHGSWLMAHSNNEPSTTSYEPTTMLALFSALLFVSHPVQTQAVTYIWQRVTSLATFFYLLSLVMYIKSRMHASGPKLHAKRYSLYAAFLLSAVLAMLTKEITFTLPVVITLYEFIFFGGNLRKRILYLGPILAAMLIIPFTLISNNQVDPTRDYLTPATVMSRSDYLFTQFRVVVTYIRLLFLPINQNLDYDYPVYTSFLNPSVFLSFLFLLSIFCFGVFLLYRSRLKKVHGTTAHKLPAMSYERLIAFGIFWFFITHSVESSIIPIRDVIFEHRVYLPSIGIFISVATSLLFFINRIKDRSEIFYKMTYFILSLIIITLTGETYARNAVWTNDITLWEDVVTKSPLKARAHGNLGKAYLDKGRIDKAFEHLHISLRLDAKNSRTHNNIGVAYGEKELLKEAEEHYQIALKLNPEYADAHFNLGVLYLRIGLTENARKEFEIALQLQPRYYEAQQFFNYIPRH